MRRAAEWIAVVAAFALVAWLMTVNLSALPGLHGDEAWFGLRADDIANGRNASVHGMNGYTGAVFPFLVSLAFRAFGASVATLRGVGVSASLVALALLAGAAWVASRERFALLALLAVFAGSLLFTSESRVGWEVTGLHPLLAAVSIFVAVFWLDGADAWRPARTLAATAALVLAAALGTYAHVIFLAMVGALLLASLVCAARRPSARSAQLLLAQAGASGTAAALEAGKLLAFRAETSTRAALVGAAAFLAVAIALVATAVARPRVYEATRAFFERRAVLLQRVLFAALVAGGLAFAGTHLLGFVDALASDVVSRRLYSVPFDVSLRVLSYASAIALVALVPVVLWKKGSTSRPAQYLLLTLPLAAMATLPIVVATNLLRHYVLNNLVQLAGASVAIVLLPPRVRERTAGAWTGLAALVILHTTPILRDPHHYAEVTPIRFRIGYETETSAHFFSTRDVIAQLRAANASNVVTKEPFFLGLPIAFERLRAPPVGPGQARVDYDYERKGGIAVSIDGRPE